MAQCVSGSVADIEGARCCADANRQLAGGAVCHCQLEVEVAAAAAEGAVWVRVSQSSEPA